MLLEWRGTLVTVFPVSFVALDVRNSGGSNLSRVGVYRHMSKGVLLFLSKPAAWSAMRVKAANERGFSDWATMSPSACADV
jgi:hypothetical protein